jgi:hypothetical protein
VSRRHPRRSGRLDYNRPGYRCSAQVEWLASDRTRHSPFEQHRTCASHPDFAAKLQAWCLDQAVAVVVGDRIARQGVRDAGDEQTSGGAQNSKSRSGRNAC